MISGNNRLFMKHQIGVMVGVNANGTLAMAAMRYGHGANGIAIGTISMTIVSIKPYQKKTLDKPFFC